MPEAPPRLHLLHLTCEEYDRLAEWAMRFTNPCSPTYVRLARSYGGRRWICAEENVVGTLETECDESTADPVLAFLDDIGADHLDIPERLLAVLPHSLPADAEEIVLGYDPLAGTFELIDGLHDLVVAHVDAGPMPSWIGTGPGHIVDIDPQPVLALFSRCPVSVGPDEMSPFVHVALSPSRVEFSRDFTPWGLGVERVSMSAHVQYRTELSFYTPTAIMHLAGLCDPSYAVEMAFFFHRPLLVRFAQDDWTLWVLGGHRSVTVVRPRVVAALTDAGWTVDNDPDGGPTAVLGVHRGEDRAEVRLLPVLSDSDAIVRLECTAAQRVPWSDELGREIAELNAAWPGEKVIHRDGRLVVARDASSGSCDELGRFLEELLARTRTLTDVVGVFL